MIFSASQEFRPGFFISVSGALMFQGAVTERPVQVCNVPSDIPAETLANSLNDACNGVIVMVESMSNFSLGE